ncbi:dockerin type I repeat-containing protein [Ruminococcus flavefaciens]|uniref:dockerin type I repeat-containing protein n=1 Tax=Ruminococcus flavefaciens TaxID=1265 RepID=UPI0004655024|nr:dockerin type I repeat-containing protein [Ruminococcus flavefaciens]
MKKIIIIMLISTMLLSGVIVPITANAGIIEESKSQEMTTNLDEEELIPYIHDDTQNFTYDCVLVCLKRTFGSLNKEWKISDFTVSNLTNVEDLTHMEMTPERQAKYLEEVDFHQILKFTLKEQSYDAVMKAIEEFEKCEGILSVGPNYIPNRNGILQGDTNCDGIVDMADVVLIMQALANPNKYGENGTAEVHLTAQGKTNADMDCNGLTVGDAQTIQNKLLGLYDTADVQIEKTIDWYHGNLPSGVFEKCRGIGKNAVITNKDELKVYIEQVVPEEAIITYLEKYNDIFFKDNVLLIDSVNQTRGAVIGYAFDSVEISDDEINITIKNMLSYEKPAADLMSLCIVQVNVPKTTYNNQTVNWKVST